MVLEMMKKTLKPGGKAIIKVLGGPSVDEVIEAYLNQFDSVTKVKPSASRSESNEMYIYANGYGFSKQEFAQKQKQIKMDVQNLRTTKDLEEFEQSINDEGKMIAENILKDLHSTGQEISPGMKKALSDLGIDDSDLKEPPLTKSRFLEQKKKQEKHRAEIEEKIEKKFGIKRKFKNISEDELAEKSEKIEHELDSITAAEKELLDYTKLEYDGSVEYAKLDKEDPYDHIYESHNRILERIKELKEEGLIESGKKDDKDAESEVGKLK